MTASAWSALTAERLLAASRDLLTRADASGTGIWPRAAALLARQAIEQAMADLWAADPRTVPLATCSRRSQLACLPAYAGEGAAALAGYTWAALSAACHYHPYELAPTATELAGWIDQAAELLRLLPRRRDGLPGRRGGPG